VRRRRAYERGANIGALRDAVLICSEHRVALPASGKLLKVEGAAVS